MKILILYASVGQGHKQASVSLNKVMKKVYGSGEIQCIDLVSSSLIIIPLLKIVFLYLVRHFPLFWESIYKHINFFYRLSPLFKAIEISYFFSLRKTLNEMKPHFVITTVGFPFLSVIEYLLRKYSPDSKFIVVITDFISGKIWFHKSVDYYFVGCNKVRNDLVKLGISPARIMYDGIPIDIRFESSQCRQPVYSESGVNTPTIMIMFGGLGIGPFDTIISSLLKHDIRCRLIIVCGQNMGLQRRLKRLSRCTNRSEILVFGFSKQISELMEQSDILITKPGGLSVSEAISKRLPMILYNSIHGLESENLAFLVKEGVAIVVEKPHEISTAVQSLINNKQYFETMKKNIDLLYKKGAAYNIREHILQLAPDS